MKNFNLKKYLAEGRLTESTESKWNSIDVSRKAEKELSNKEWNERTAKKLKILTDFNNANKFKKDWDEEKLQGWVDKNYSWEKLTQQFKLNENQKLKEVFSEKQRKWACSQDGPEFDEMCKDTAISKKKNIKEWVGGELEKRSNDYFEKLVPGQGNADTIEGELLRAINRIIYRYYNDGDFYYKGYGTETAGPAHSFLINSTDIPLEIQSTLKSIFSKIMSSSGDEEKTYERLTEFALEKILDHIDSKDGNYTQSNEDMLKYDSEFEDEDDEYEDDYFDEDEDDDEDYD